MHKILHQSWIFAACSVRLNERGWVVSSTTSMAEAADAVEGAFGNSPGFIVSIAISICLVLKIALSPEASVVITFKTYNNTTSSPGCSEEKGISSRACPSLWQAHHTVNAPMTTKHYTSCLALGDY